ncbi:MAG: hypothetical protein RLZZ200_2782 [Pseudomonadota bacterium]|jgi:predicted Zn-dependent protease
MPQSIRFRAVTAALLLFATSLPAAPAQDPAVVVAEMALQKGQCREAAEAFAKASAASGAVDLAARATQVALGCEQLDVAQRAAVRWQQLAPGRGEPALARGLVAMKRFQVEEARKALVAWRDSGAAGNQDPGHFAQVLESETDSVIAYRLFGDVLLGDDPTAEVLLAQATLALHAFDYQGAVKFADRALALRSGSIPVQLLKVRALAMLGDAAPALDLARELDGKLADDDAFLAADVLAAAQRIGAAREELERLRDKPGLGPGVERRLGAIALEQGDLDAAEKHFMAIMGQRAQAPVALLSLSRIFERRGDDERALRGYALLADSSASLAARAGAARVLLKQGKREQALSLFDGYLKQHPESAIEVAGARAQLFAGRGEAATAVAVLDEALKEYPNHPQLQYQRATMLERAGRHAEAERSFEALRKQRPEDPGVANALGFTLADHNRSLERAENLIRQALGASPDNPAILDSLGWVRYRRGHLDDAILQLERAWRGLHDAEIGAHFGEVLWKKGNEGRARYVWQQSLNVDPDDELLRATMRRLTGEELPRGDR